MNKEMFSRVAKLIHNNAFSDKELEEIVAVYDCLIEFFQYRHETFVLSGLRSERNVFEGFIEARKRVAVQKI